MPSSTTAFSSCRLSAMPHRTGSKHISILLGRVYPNCREYRKSSSFYQETHKDRRLLPNPALSPSTRGCWRTCTPPGRGSPPRRAPSPGTGVPRRCASPKPPAPGWPSPCSPAPTASTTPPGPACGRGWSRRSWWCAT